MDRVEHEKLVIQELVNLNRSQELNLSPWYQRRSVWTTTQKSYLINTLFEQKPIPSLYVRHSLDLAAEKSIREIVDGQQRVRAILEYADNKFPAKHPAHPKKMLCRDLTRPEQEKFKLTSISVGYLLGATDSDVIEIFGRLNSVAKTLNAQEKRNATFSGEFKQFCLKEAAKRLALWRGLDVFTDNDVARMQEVEFVSDLVLNLINGLSDFSNSALARLYKMYDEDFPEEPRIAHRLESIFEKIADMKSDAIRGTIFSRRPLFFSLCYALDTKSQLNKGKLEAALHMVDSIYNKDMEMAKRSQEEVAFIAACTSTTQRIKSRRIRHRFLVKYL